MLQIDDLSSRWSGLDLNMETQVDPEETGNSLRTQWVGDLENLTNLPPNLMTVLCDPQQTS